VKRPTLGATRIHGELQKLASSCRRPPWRSTSGVAVVLRRSRGARHVSELASIDFFTVPTVTFRVLFVFVVLCHDRRRLVHVNVTAHPTAARTAQQLCEAWPWNTAPLHDPRS
jgi:putative transposase